MTDNYHFAFPSACTTTRTSAHHDEEKNCSRNISNACTPQPSEQREDAATQTLQGMVGSGKTVEAMINGTETPAMCNTSHV